MFALSIGWPTASAWASSWTDRYVSALANKNCTQLESLANESGISIHTLAKIRFIELCTTNNSAQSLSIISQIADESSLAWARPLSLKIAIDLATKLQDDRTLAYHALARSQDLGSQAEKEALLKSALAAAKRLGDANYASQIATELYRVSPRLITNPDKAEWLKVADDFRTNQGWTGALKYYQKIIDASASPLIDSLKARDGVRQVHKAKFRFFGGPLTEFLKASGNVAKFCESKLKNGTTLDFDIRRQLFEAWMQYPRDVWSYGDVKVAKREIDRANSLTWLEPVFKAYAFWLKAKIHANASEWDLAISQATHSVDQLHSLSATRDSWTTWHWTLWEESHWALALAFRKKSKLHDAAQTLDRALSVSASSSPFLRLLFWAGQNHADLGENSSAQGFWNQLAQSDPYGFYGQLAHYKTRQPLSPLPEMDLDHVTRPSSVIPLDFDILMQLRDAGEEPLAQSYSRQLLPSDRLDIDELKLRAAVFDFSTVLSLVFKLVPPDQRNSFISRYARLLYPRPFAATIDDAIHRAPRIEAEYVLAIMRQESGFNRFALSWANAYGLLQLLPSVAHGVERKAGVRFTEDYELFLPEKNIPLGVAHMDDVIGLIGTSFILRTATYNAALSKVKSWKQQLYHGNVFEFLEEIPYDETRTYVRLVLRNYLMNRRLNSSQPIDFPADVLEM